MVPIFERGLDALAYQPQGVAGFDGGGDVEGRKCLWLLGGVGATRLHRWVASRLHESIHIDRLLLWWW